jgi:DNA-binding CsgD family transcriptional regulator
MRAADAALEGSASEEAIRLYRLALDVGGPELDAGERSAALLGTALSSARLVDLPAAARAADAAMAAARQTRDGGRQLAAVALALECVGDRAWDRAIRDRCREALSVLTPEAQALRARVLGRLTEAAIYDGDHQAVLETSAEAMALAEQSGEVDAVVSALRARQLTLSGVGYVEERAALASQMIDVAARHRRPLDEMWGHQWAIDVDFQKGDLRGVAHQLGAMRTCAERAGGVMARWHVLISEGALAQATAQFDEAIACSREAFELLMSRRHPAAFGAHMAAVAAVRHHVGVDAVPMPFDTTRPPDELAEDRTEVRAPIFMYLGPAVEMAEAGRIDDARMLLAHAGAVDLWDPPPYFYVSVYSLASRAFGLIGDLDSVRLCCERLEPHRGNHVVTGAGTASYLGPVELELGRAARLLGRLADSARDLRTTSDLCRRNGAVAFVAEAEIELARTLLDAGDQAGAAASAAAGEKAARELGMTPWADMAADVVSKASAAAPAGVGGLSAREWEVAQLVARGRTNREIAEELFLSVRTAQTHVQHILVKLGFANRSQIAAWVTSRRR